MYNCVALKGPFFPGACREMDPSLKLGSTLETGQGIVTL